jgi:hypothetical protein
MTRALVADCAGVVSVPDDFAGVAVIVGAAARLRHRWPAIAYVYLNPMASARSRSSRTG